jgi:hypothetical protein
VSMCKSCSAARHAGAKGEGTYSSYSFLSSALDGGEWSASRPDRVKTHGPIGYEAGWASKLGICKRFIQLGSFFIKKMYPILSFTNIYFTYYSITFLKQVMC